MGMGGGGSTTSVQKTEPWEEQKPYLEEGFNLSRNWLYGDQPQYYPFSTYVPFSPETQAGLAGQTQMALSGSPVAAAAGQAGAATAAGNYLYSNPAMSYLQPGAAGEWAGANPVYDALGNTAYGGDLYSNPMFAYLSNMAGGGEVGQNPWLDSAYERAAGQLTNTFNKSIKPTIEGYFEQTGQYASPQMFQQLQRAADTGLQQPLVDLAASMYGGAYDTDMNRRLQAAGMLGQTYDTGQGLRQSAANQIGSAFQGDIANLMNAANSIGGAYQAERGNQMSTLGMADALANLGYFDVNKLLDVGSTREAQSLSELQDQMSRWEFGQNAERDKLMNYLQMVGGTGYGGTSTTKTNAGGSGAGMGDALGALGTVAGAFMSK